MDSIKFNHAYLQDAFSIAGPLEKEGKIRDFDLELDDYYYHEKTFELAEVKMQRVVIEQLLMKNHLIEKDIHYLIGGDLSNQISVSSYAARYYKIPFLGVYSACACFVEAVLLGAKLVDGRSKKRALVVTSSHNLNAEKQFRFPIEYGALKPKTTTFTATGCVGALICQEGKIRIEGATIGKVVDMGIQDATNMGAVMAPAAASVLYQHLQDFKRNVDDYDLILTGDLGSVGSALFREYLKRTYHISMMNHMDAATEIYKTEQDTYAGASGPVALPLVLFNLVLKSHRYQKILIIGTGSLHSPTFVNQKESIPAISHAVSLEVLS